MQNQHCAGFPHDVYFDFFQFSFGRLCNATHFLLSLDFFYWGTLLLCWDFWCLYTCIFIIYWQGIPSLTFQYMLETLSWSGRRRGGEHLSLNLDMWHPLQSNYVKRVPNNFEVISRDSLTFSGREAEAIFCPGGPTSSRRSESMSSPPKMIRLYYFQGGGGGN